WGPRAGRARLAGASRDRHKTEPAAHPNPGNQPPAHPGATYRYQFPGAPRATTAPVRVPLPLPPTGRDAMAPKPLELNPDRSPCQLLHERFPTLAECAAVDKPRGPQ